MRNIGKKPDVKTMSAVPKSGCLKIKKETNKTAVKDMNQSEYFGFNSIMGNDTTELQERTEWKNNVSILNWFSKWNHEYDSHLRV